MLKVYVDGACKTIDNHKKGGVGVYFGPKDERNYSGKLEGELQTNNRAEIMACIVALKRISNKKEDVEIKSDSQYVVNSMTKWIKKWKINGWKNAKNNPVLNKDLLIELEDLKNSFINNGYKIKWTWVRGHSGIAGNEAADYLATKGVELWKSKPIKKRKQNYEVGNTPCNKRKFVPI